MQAAIGVAQLKKLNKFIIARNKNFNIFYGLLTRYEKYFILPKTTAGSHPSWFGFPILVKADAPFSRKDIVNFLEKSKIATRMLFGGNLTKQPAYEKIRNRVFGSLKNTDLVMNNLFWIGVYPGISKGMIEYIVDKFNKFIKTKE